MFLLHKPKEEEIRQFLDEQKGQSFSYDEIGATKDEDAPRNYQVDHNRQNLGKGHKIFELACKAVCQWKMFDTNWTHIFPADTPIEIDRTVAILIRHFGFWSLNAARIVYVINTSNSESELFGFAYGTLTEHGERGEERFLVEFDKITNDVFYDLYAFSQPQHFPAKLGYPLSRYLQKQFAANSKNAMKNFILVGKISDSEC